MIDCSDAARRGGLDLRGAEIVYLFALAHGDAPASPKARTAASPLPQESKRLARCGVFAPGRAAVGSRFKRAAPYPWVVAPPVPPSMHGELASWVLCSAAFLVLAFGWAS